MAPLTKQAVDYVIINRSNVDTRGSGMVTVWTLHGPGLDTTGKVFRDRDAAIVDGRERAEAARVSLWEEPDPAKNEGLLIVSFR